MSCKLIWEFYYGDKMMQSLTDETVAKQYSQMMYAHNIPMNLKVIYNGKLIDECLASDCFNEIPKEREI